MGTYSSRGVRRKETCGHGSVKVVLQRAVVSDAAIRSSDRPNIFDRPLRSCWERRGGRGNLPVFEVHKVEMEASNEE